MTHPASIRCHCDECEKLDRLPARRQGIPGAWQSTLLNRMGFNAPEDGWRHDTIYHFNAPNPKPQATPDALPLFMGALEPTLF
jgi:hypothetical protein